MNTLLGILLLINISKIIYKILIVIDYPLLSMYTLLLRMSVWVFVCLGVKEKQKRLIFEILIIYPWGHVRYHTKFGPDRFSRFDVYWIQTIRQTYKQSIYIN